MKDEVVRVIKGFKGEITSLSWNEEGELASGGNDNSVRLFKGFDEVGILSLSLNTPLFFSRLSFPVVLSYE